LKSQDLSRDTILTALKNALQPIEGVNAMWEGGAIGWGRFDEWSDIDLQVDVDDPIFDLALQKIMDTLASLSPVDLRYDVQQPTSHGHFQTFIRLKNTSPYLVLDMVVMKHSNQEKFLEREIHGEPVIHFDKTGMLQANPFDREALLSAILKRLQRLPIIFELNQVFVKKEINRGHGIEAISYYFAATIRPLMEALRLRYYPLHYDFQTRYVYDELPQSVLEQLEPLYFPQDLNDLAQKRQFAEELFFQTLREIDPGTIQSTL